MHIYFKAQFLCFVPYQDNFEKKASVKCSGRFIITEIANASDAVDTNEKTENRITKTQKREQKKLKTE